MHEEHHDTIDTSKRKFRRFRKTPISTLTSFLALASIAGISLVSFIISCTPLAERTKRKVIGTGQFEEMVEIDKIRLTEGICLSSALDALKNRNEKRNTPEEDLQVQERIPY